MTVNTQKSITINGKRYRGGSLLRLALSANADRPGVYTLDGMTFCLEAEDGTLTEDNPVAVWVAENDSQTPPRHVTL